MLSHVFERVRLTESAPLICQVFSFFLRLFLLRPKTLKSQSIKTEVHLTYLQALIVLWFAVCNKPLNDNLKSLAKQDIVLYEFYTHLQGKQELRDVLML